MARDPAFLFLLCALAALAQGQPVSFGVSAGVPISPASQNQGQGCIATQPPQCGPNDFYAKLYAVGPAIGLNLHWGISIQASALYERFHIDQTVGLYVGRGGGSVNFGHEDGLAADAWLFPLQLRYTRGRGRLAPFVEAGATLRHLGTFNGSGTQLDYYLQPYTTSFRIETGRNLDVAITAGAGVKWRIPVVDVAPEIRFLRWTSSYYQPAQDQLMLIVGITFPLRR
jgi:hypothetical protein